MGLNSGFIKLHRSITSWEWYQDANASRVFIHLLLTANYKPSRWQGLTVLPGQRIASIAKLSDELQISTKCIRTALEQLESTGEIKKESTNRFTVFTVVNYEKYQDRANEGQADFADEFQNRASKGQTVFADISTFTEGDNFDLGKRRANKGQTEGKQRATKEEDKELEEYKEYREIRNILSGGVGGARAHEGEKPVPDEIQAHADAATNLGNLPETVRLRFCSTVDLLFATWEQKPSQRDYSELYQMLIAHHTQHGMESFTMSSDDIALMTHAFEAASNAGKKSLSYIKGVFKKYRQRGIKTDDDYWDYEIKRNAKSRTDITQTKGR